MWKLRVRSTGKRQKPVYIDDRYFPMHAKEHFASFIGAMTGQDHDWFRRLSFNYQWGVTKHSKLGYIQIKNVKTGRPATPIPKVYKSLLPYFLPDIIHLLYHSSLNGAVEDPHYRYQILVDERKGNFTLVEPGCATCMTMDEGIRYVYDQWIQDPNYFEKFHQRSVTVPVEKLRPVNKNGRMYSEEVFRQAVEQAT